MSLYNQTNKTNFLIDIPDAGLTKGFRLNVQSSLVPGIRISPINIPSGDMGLGRANIPGSTIEYDPLVIRFLVDENLDSWVELYKWMLITNNYLTHHNTAGDQGKVPEFITLHILDNCKKNIVQSIHFHGAWCSELGELEYEYTDESTSPMQCTATFNYKYFTVERNGVIITDRLSIESNYLQNASSKDALL